MQNELSPILFLTVVDTLLKNKKEENCGLPVHSAFIGATTRADGLRTSGASKHPIVKHNAVISNFTDTSCFEVE